MAFAVIVVVILKIGLVDGVRNPIGLTRKNLKNSALQGLTTLSASLRSESRFVSRRREKAHPKNLRYYYIKVMIP